MAIQRFLRTYPRKDDEVDGPGPWRLRLEADGVLSGWTSFALEKMTSRRRGAQPLPGIGEEIVMNDEELVWLHAMIGERMRERGINIAAAPETPTGS